jgi:SWI/SNF-related matrix-associated actin-dependent regulator 1 of chromatin subfamily A
MWQEKVNDLLPGWSTTIIEGYSKGFDSNAKVIIASYAVFSHRVPELRAVDFDVVVYDEVHALSNRNSLRSRAATQLTISNVVGLSGTPFLNRPKELWPLLNLLQPAVWSNFWKFGHTYCDAKKDAFGHWDFDGASNLPELKEKIQHLMLRRTKDEVLKELPDLLINNLPYLPLNKSLIRSYKEAYEVAKSMPSNIPVRARTLMLRKVVGLMKVDPAIELASDLLSDGGKVVLFAVHKEVVAKLGVGLESYGVIKIVGDTPQKDRNDLVNAFQSDPKLRGAIISEAGGEGINLFAANNLIFVEREWNPGKETQIIGRIHRIGQVNPCQVHYIIAKNTIDERIHRIINQKREVLGQVYTFENIPINDLLDIK